MAILRLRGFTLVELLVIIAIIGTFVGLLLPATGRGSRVTARSNTCRSHLRQIEKAIAQREAAFGEIPGYVNPIGIEGRKEVRASWVVTTFPYIEEPDLWHKWANGNYEFKELEILICPSDPPSKLGYPELSYCANAGYVGNSAGVENPANGVFFDNTRIVDGNPGPEDERDLANSSRVQMSWSYIQKHDGVTNTIMLAENINAFYWGYLSEDDRLNTLDRKYHYGVCWEQPTVLLKEKDSISLTRKNRINGHLQHIDHTYFKDMKPEYGFPSSNHPGGVNIALADGSARFISENIDPMVYAQLMTSNSKESDLINLNSDPIVQEELQDDAF